MAEQSHMLQPCRGRVYMRRRRPFRTDENEVLQNHGQLPQFFPRLDWPQELSDADPTHRYGNEAGDPESMAEEREQIERDYAHLHPMTSFGNNLNTYKDIDWVSHVGNCHNILYHGLPRRRGLSANETNHLLAIASYGMGHSMTWLEHPFWIAGRDANLGGQWRQQEVPEFGHRMAEGYLGFDADDADTRAAIQRRIAGRRWLVVPVHSSRFHWSMTIFDRQQGQLYIFDTLRADRVRRITAIVQIWARFWNALGAPYHFTYFSPPTAAQPEGWECGYLGVLWVMHMLRDQVGNYLSAADVLDGRDHRFCPLDRTYAIEDSSLPIRDWRPMALRAEGQDASTQECLDHVRHIFLAMLGNELGIHDHPAMELGLTPGAAERTPYARIQAMRDILHRHHGQVSIILYWSSLGGAQFTPPMNIEQAYGNYHESDRVHAWPHRNRHRILCTAAELAAENPFPRWTDDERFTAQNSAAQFQRATEPAPAQRAAEPAPAQRADQGQLVVIDILNRPRLEDVQEPNLRGPWQFDVGIYRNQLNGRLARISPQDPTVTVSHVYYGPPPDFGADRRRRVVIFDVEAQFPGVEHRPVPKRFTYIIPDDGTPWGDDSTLLGSGSDNDERDPDVPIQGIEGSGDNGGLADGQGGEDLDLNEVRRRQRSGAPPPESNPASNQSFDHEDNDNSDDNEEEDNEEDDNNGTGENEDPTLPPPPPPPPSPRALRRSSRSRRPPQRYGFTSHQNSSTNQSTQQTHANTEDGEEGSLRPRKTTKSSNRKRPRSDDGGGDDDSTRHPRKKTATGRQRANSRGRRRRRG